MITFYSMNGCPHCTNSINMLKKEIDSGLVIVKPHTEAPSTAKGFPYFIHDNNEHTGAPKSKTELFQKLGVSTESYTHCPKTDCATEPRWPGNCNFNTYGWWKAGVI